MVVLSDLADDERTARMVLSMLVEPNDPVTGRVINGLGAMETLRQAAAFTASALPLCRKV